MNSLKFTVCLGLFSLIGCGTASINELSHEFKVEDEAITITYKGDVLDDDAWQFLVSDFGHFASNGSLAISEGTISGHPDGVAGRYILLKYSFGGSYRMYQNSEGTAFEIPEDLARAYTGAAQSFRNGGYTDDSLRAFVERLNRHQDHSIRNDILPSQIVLFSGEQLDLLEAVNYYLFDENLARGWWFDVDGHSRVPGVVIGFSETTSNEKSHDLGMNVRIAVFVDGRWYLWK